MKKQKGSLVQRMLAVLLAAVLVTGMVCVAAPISVLAQEQEEAQESDSKGVDIPITGIKIKPNAITINLNGNRERQMEATVIPSNTTQSKEVVWTSTDENVAAVSQDGIVTAKKPGKTKITVTSKANSAVYATCGVTVFEVYITGVTIAPQTAALKVGETIELEAAVEPSDTTQSKEVTWTSSDESVATVSQGGIVTATGVGTATITAVSVGNGKFSASCVITVTEQPTEKYTVTVNGGTGGGEYEAGATVTITADAPASGKQFDKWTVNSGSVTLTDATSSTTTFAMPAEAVSVTATYKDIVEEHIHRPIRVDAKDATCTAAGKQAYYHCEGCGKNYEDAAGTKTIADISAWGNIAALGHDWGEWKVTKKATATKPGEKERTCKRCDEKETETISATGGGSQGGGNGGSGDNGGGNDQGGGSDGGSGGNDQSGGSDGGSGENNGGVVHVRVESGSDKKSGGKDDEPKTGDATPIELVATLSMIAGFTYLLLYFADRRHGMTEETKKELVSRLVAWGKQGTRIRRYLALAAIFVLLVYYHSIGKKTCVEWKEIYGE